MMHTIYVSPAIHLEHIVIETSTIPPRDSHRTSVIQVLTALHNLDALLMHRLVTIVVFEAYSAIGLIAIFPRVQLLPCP